jgi:hypothetical protein
VKALSLIAVLAIAAMLGLAAPAAANDLFTLDPQATSAGHLAEDASGNAYVTWTRKASGGLPDSPMFCKIPPGGRCTAPIALPIPGAVDASDGVAGVFPVLGPGSTVYVVAPRYVKNDVVIWTSTNSGQSFDAGTLNAGGYSNKSEPTNVLLSGSTLLIGAFNPGLGFSTTPAAGGAGANFEFASPGSGGVATSSLGLDGSGNPVEAYWNLSDPYQMFFYRYKGSGTITTEANWEGPTAIGNGYETKLAGGASGLFLVSQDYSGGAYPSALDVRRYQGTGFGAPLTLANNSSIDLFAGGAIAQSPSGLVGVAWPGTRGGGQARVMRLFLSSNGGASFTETDVAHIGDSYALGDNPQLALGNSGAGWLSFRDAGGLRMADLNPIAPYVPPKLPPFKGKEKTIAKPVGDFELTLRLPKSCLQSQQPFYAGAGKRVRHKVAKALRSKLTLVKASFSFDGRKLKTLKKKPLKLLIEPGPLPAGSTHTVKVRVTAIARKHGHKKKVVRTLKGQITIC